MQGGVQNWAKVDYTICARSLTRDRPSSSTSYLGTSGDSARKQSRCLITEWLWIILKARAKAIHNIQSFLSNCVQYSSLGPSCQLRSRWTGKFGLGCQVWAKLPENYKTWLSQPILGYLELSWVGLSLSSIRVQVEAGEIKVLLFYAFLFLFSFEPLTNLWS